MNIRKFNTRDARIGILTSTGYPGQNQSLDSEYQVEPNTREDNIIIVVTN